jgi:hypothetical protein
MESKHIQINDWNKKHPDVSVIFDENWNAVKRGDVICRAWGSANYSNIRFCCSKCGKLYDTYGALKYYHKKCEANK